MKKPSEGTNSTLFWETVGQNQLSNQSQRMQARNNNEYFQH
jgi:hypothetical protein